MKVDNPLNKLNQTKPNQTFQFYNERLSPGLETILFCSMNKDKQPIHFTWTEVIHLKNRNQKRKNFIISKDTLIIHEKIIINCLPTLVLYTKCESLNYNIVKAYSETWDN